MARSQAYWKQLILDLMPTKSALSVLDNPSMYGIFNSWADITSYAHFTLDKFFDLFRAEIDTKINNSFYGSTPWLVDQVKLFQYGDDLIVIDKRTGYAVIDETKQIVKLVSISENANGAATIKAAKIVSGSVVNLSGPELTSLQYYVNKKKGPGSNVGVDSQPTDLAKFYIDIYYNPLLPLADLKTQVEAAVNNYLANLDFDGKVVLLKLVDAIQSVKGVFDVFINDAQALPNAGAYVPFTRVYQTKAGYIQIDPAFPLSSTLNYIAQ